MWLFTSLLELNKIKRINLMSISNQKKYDANFNKTMKYIIEYKNTVITIDETIIHDKDHELIDVQN